VAALVAITSGCELGQDDEMAPRPTRTITKAPSPAPTTTAAPNKVPVGQGRVSPNSVVWAQESTLHFGTRQVDVSPLRIDSFVVVAGGVFFLSRSELWFTDLSRVRGTGFTGVTRVSTTRDADALVVESSAGSAGVYAYDLRTGASMPSDQAVPATDEDLRGTAEQVILRPAGKGEAAPSAASVDARRGSGRFGIVGGDGERLVVFDATTRRRVPLKGVVGNGFQLVRWQGGVAFFGLALNDGNPLAVVSCNLSSRSCTTFGKPVEGISLVFESAA
jgi:hypothetical protein